MGPLSGFDGLSGSGSFSGFRHLLSRRCRIARRVRGRRQPGASTGGDCSCQQNDEQGERAQPHLRTSWEAVRAHASRDCGGSLGGFQRRARATAGTEYRPPPADRPRVSYPGAPRVPIAAHTLSFGAPFGRLTLTSSRITGRLNPHDCGMCRAFRRHGFAIYSRASGIYPSCAAPVRLWMQLRCWGRLADVGSPPHEVRMPDDRAGEGLLRGTKRAPERLCPDGLLSVQRHRPRSVQGRRTGKTNVDAANDRVFAAGGACREQPTRPPQARLRVLVMLPVGPVPHL